MRSKLDENSGTNRYTFSVDENVLPAAPAEPKGTHLTASVFSVSFIVLSFVTLTVAILVNSFLPEPLNAKDLPEKSQRFIAERSFRNLEDLSKIGPKVVGTYENELALQYLKNEVRKIAEGSTTVNKIDYEVQTVSGCLDITLKGLGRTSCYENIQNLVVKVESPVANESILVNCHYDSVPTSPGTSDDGLHCANMLEVLRILAKTEKELKRSVVLLFNGAEEDGLLGSHGFITQHEWRKDILCFINLEACGAGGREVLFQTGPSASVLPKIYANSVPYPNGVVIGEELFQAGVIPSDTDFRIFRDFGNIKGLDLAHHKNGYVYHTSSDNISQISKSVIQNSGDNLLALLFALINYENLKESIIDSKDQAVYFDVFGQFMIHYSTQVAFFVNILTVILSTYSIRCLMSRIFKGMTKKQVFYHFSVNAIFYALEAIFVVAGVCGLAWLVKKRGLCMLWYSSQWFVITYYCVATVYIMAGVIRLRRHVAQTKLNPENEAYLFIMVMQALYTVTLFFATFLKIRSIFLLVVILVPVSILNILLVSNRLRHKPGLKALIYTIGNFLPLLYVTYLCVQFVNLFIPMMGRIGITVDSEIVIGLSCSLFTFFILSNLMPLVLLVRNWWKVQLLTGILFLIYVLVVFFGSVLTPFKDDTPERFTVLHVERKLVNPGQVKKEVSSGYLVIPMDLQAPRTLSSIFKKDNEKLKPLGDICTEHLFCGVPFIYTFLLRSMKHSYWIHRETPVFPEEKKLEFKAIETEVSKTFYLTFIDSGYIDLIILPLNNAKLTEWNLLPGVPMSKVNWKNQTVYIVHKSRGLTVDTRWQLTLTFDISKMLTKSYAFKLAWANHYRTNNTNHYTGNFQRFLSVFPSWTRVVSWVNDYEEYIF